MATHKRFKAIQIGPQSLGLKGHRHLMMSEDIDKMKMVAMQAKKFSDISGGNTTLS